MPEPENPLQAQSEQEAFELNFDNIDDVLRVNKKAKNRIELRGFLAQRDDLEALKKSLLEEREEAYGQMIQAENKCLDEDQVHAAEAERRAVVQQMEDLRARGHKYLRIAGKIGDLGGFAVGGATIVAGAAGGIVASAITLPVLAGAAILAARHFSRRAARYGAERSVRRLIRRDRGEELPEGPYRELERRANVLTDLLNEEAGKRQTALNARWAVQGIDRRRRELDLEIQEIDERCQELQSGLGESEIPSAQ